MSRATALLACLALGIALFATAAGASFGREPAATAAKHSTAKQKHHAKRCAKKKAKRRHKRRPAHSSRTKRKKKHHRRKHSSCKRKHRHKKKKATKAPTTTPGKQAPPTPGKPAPTTPSAPAPSLGTYVSVAAREYSLTLSRPAVAAGSFSVELRNVGEDPHDLVLSPDDASHTPLKQWGETAPGGRQTLKANLPAGRYVLWCSLEGHEALGMHAKLRVGG